MITNQTQIHDWQVGPGPDQGNYGHPTGSLRCPVLSNYAFAYRGKNNLVKGGEICYF
jgi:hypothetical protein